MFYSTDSEKYYLYSYVFKDDKHPAYEINESAIFYTDETGQECDGRELAQRHGYVPSWDLFTDVSVNKDVSTKRSPRKKYIRDGNLSDGRDIYKYKNYDADVKYKFDKKQWLDEVLKAHEKKFSKEYYENINNYALEA